MTLNIRIETFKQDGTHTYERKDYRSVTPVGTVEVDLGNEVVTPRARMSTIGDKTQVSVAGFVGRYQTSNKAWPAHVYQDAGAEGPQAYFGRDDRSGRFNKLRGITYEPETYERVGNPGWFMPN